MLVMYALPTRPIMKIRLLVFLLLAKIITPEGITSVRFVLFKPIVTGASVSMFLAVMSLLRLSEIDHVKLVLKPIK